MIDLRGSAPLALLLASLLSACAGGSKTSGAPPPFDPARPDDALVLQGMDAFSAGDLAAAEGRALLAADPVSNAAAAQARFGAAVGSYAEARALFDQVAPRYPASVRLSLAAAMAGRCSYEIGTIDAASEVAAFTDARARLLAHAATWPSGREADVAAYFLGRTRYRLAGLVPPLDGFDTARADFRRALALAPAGTYADNALYYVGRCSYELAWPVISGPTPLPTSPDFAPTKALLDEAEAVFLELLGRFPASSYADNATYYLGRSFLDEPTDNTASTAERVANLDLASLRFGQVIVTPASIFIDGARYWRGRTSFALSFYRPPAPVLAAALADFQAVAPSSSYKDNAMAFEARVHARGGDCPSAQAALAALQAAYPMSTWIPSTASYLTASGC